MRASYPPVERTQKSRRCPGVVGVVLSCARRYQPGRTRPRGWRHVLRRQAGQLGRASGAEESRQASSRRENDRLCSHIATSKARRTVRAPRVLSFGQLHCLCPSRNPRFGGGGTLALLTDEHVVGAGVARTIISCARRYQPGRTRSLGPCLESESRQAWVVVVKS